MDVKVDVASQQKTTLKESPGIITLITRSDIESMGARDLLDILASVPGFAPALDVTGVVGIGVRGNWAHEGKVLLLIDGHELNEIAYGNISLGFEFPVDQIERVEIIRGPGSVQYGGSAGLAVIRVFTRKSELDGIRATTTAGAFSRSISRGRLSLQSGMESSGIKWSIGASSGTGLRSQNNYIDSVGNSYSMKDASKLSQNLVRAQVEFSDIELSYLYHEHQVHQGDAYGEFGEVIPVGFTTHSTRLKKAFHFSDKISLTPTISYKSQLPWTTFTSDPTTVTDTSAARLRGDLVLSGEVNENWNFSAGTMGFEDSMKDYRTAGSSSIVFPTDERKLSFTNYGIFGEAGFSYGRFRALAGVRGEHHSRFGNSLVPRLSLIQGIGDLGLKLLISEAFRAPTLLNLLANSDIKPEYLDNIEFEVSHPIGSFANISMNFFDTKIRKTIVYGPDSNAIDTYQNSGDSGSRGLEVEGKLKTDWVTGKMSYSFAVTRGAPIERYSVPTNSDLFLGLPTHQIFASFELRPEKDSPWSLTPVFFFQGQRYGYEWDASSSAITLQQTPAQLTTHLIFQKRDLFLNRLNGMFGLYNAFDIQTKYIQPYFNTVELAHPPLPGPGREWVVKLSYEIPIGSDKGAL
jgi:outer membrane cobalamin receptor